MWFRPVWNYTVPKLKFGFFFGLCRFRPVWNYTVPKPLTWSPSKRSCLDLYGITQYPNSDLFYDRGIGCLDLYGITQYPNMPIIFEEAVTQIVDKYPWLGRSNRRLEFTDASRMKLHKFILNAMPKPINPDLLEPCGADRDELLNCIRSVGEIVMKVRLGRTIPHKLSIVGKIGR